MLYSSESIERIVDILSSLPTIGRKTAQRLAYYLLRQPEEYANSFANALLELKKNVKFCSTCFNYTETDPCQVCSSQKRNRSLICVVEEPNDVSVIEKTGEFSGLYHVLHGVINPLDGISPNDLKIRELILRLSEVKEVILALNPSIEGEVTTQYISKQIKPLEIKVTRLARGLPIGSELEFADDATISRALESRIEV